MIGNQLLGRISVEVEKNEKVQRTTTRYVMNDYSYHSSVTSMLQALKWQTLEQRRIYSFVMMLYKISHNLVSVDQNHLQVSKNSNDSILTYKISYDLLLSSNYQALERIASQHQGLCKPPVFHIWPRLVYFLNHHL